MTTATIPTATASFEIDLAEMSEIMRKFSTIEGTIVFIGEYKRLEQELADTKAQLASTTAQLVKVTGAYIEALPI